MKQRAKIIIFLLTYLITLSGLNAQIRINEIMQSNIDVLVDDLQDFPDSWIEFYNESDEPINMQGWYISTSSNFINGWQLKTSAIVAPKNFLVVYCDKVDLGLHTDFRIDSGKGSSLYIFNEDGLLVDKLLNIPKQPAPNISCGRLKDNVSDWNYFVKPTPNASNTEKQSDIILGNVLFSLSGGVFSSPVSLTLSLPPNHPPDVNISHIYYTLDGSEPTELSLVYDRPIEITSTTIVRAKIIHPDYLSRYSYSQTYILESREFSLPIISLITHNDYMYDDEFGIYVRGNGKYGIKGMCTEGLVNWANDWRRPVNIEYFSDSKSKSIINQLGEMRIAGGCSRANPQKSLFLYANKRFGDNKRFQNTFFQIKEI